MQLSKAGEIHEGVMPLDKRRFLIPGNEIIVDNEDEGFRIEEPSRRRKIFRKQKDPELTGYGDGVDFLTRNFSGWLKSVYSYAYGSSIRSFYGKATENGESKACWETDIPEDGRCELYVYHLGLQSRYQEYRLAGYYYTVEQAGYRAHITIGIDKKDKRTVQVKDNAGYMDELEYYMDFFQGNAWVPVGTYDLKKGKSKLLLHDRQLVFADAIKWVKQER